MKELRLRRMRHGITEKALAEHLGVSSGWVRSLEKYYHGPSIREWSVRYQAALDEMIEAKKGKGSS